MARISDTIEEFLKLLLEESGGKLEIQRNELADYFECAPSQINYVLATRFSLESGYYIESRRGGGGYIRIIYLDINDDDYLYRLIRKGYKGFFNPEEILVYHPCKKMNIEEEIKKAHSYGMGMGAFFKKHLIRERDFSLIKVFFSLFLIRPIGGILSGLLKLNYKISLLYINVLVARWKGLVKY